MYNVILGAHNIVRWLVLVAAIWAMIRAYSGWLGARTWTPADKQAGFFFTTTFDTQLLIGIILVVVSPLTHAAAANLAAIMSTDMLRFFIAEHIPLMVLALIVVHVTSVLAQRAPEDAGKFKRSALGYTLALVMVAVAIPWWRPLFPGL